MNPARGILLACFRSPVTVKRSDAANQYEGSCKMIVFTVLIGVASFKMTPPQVTEHEGLLNQLDEVKTISAIDIVISESEHN